MRMKAKHWMAVTGVLLGALSASAKDLDAKQIQQILKTEVDGVAKLPVSGLTLIEAGGKSFLVSDNGRIVVTGRIFDMWNAVEMKSVSDVNKWGPKLDFKKMGLDVEELGPISIGAGKEDVVVFVDPNCTSCQKLLQLSTKMTRYTFKVVLLPTMGADSDQKVRRGACYSDKSLVAKALLDNDWTKVPEASKECSNLPVQKSIIAARVFGINSVPFLINSHGLSTVGMPKDLSAWLAENGEKSPEAKDDAKSLKNNAFSSKDKK